MHAAPVDLLVEHVRRFNEGMRSGDFAPMIAGFTPDAEMMFEGAPIGPFLGRDAIAEAYDRHPPDDEILLLGEPRLEGDVVESDYAWVAKGTRAGRIILTVRDGAIARLVVTFE
ncbi:MAG: nuclear transport factor 2 family protein [Actinobacteria bacterium]|nr:nuclear transport factor 2 family protein [Actinomycetota bacterium]